MSELRYLTDAELEQAYFDESEIFADTPDRGLVKGRLKAMMRSANGAPAKYTFIYGYKVDTTDVGESPYRIGRFIGTAGFFLSDIPDQAAITRHDIAVVMITTDRVPSYFAQTCQLLRESEGLDSFLDIERSGVAISTFIDSNHKPNRNAAQALGWGASQNRKWVLFLEDDLRFCNRFIDSVAAWLSKYHSAFDNGYERYTASPIYLFGSASIVDTPKSKGIHTVYEGLPHGDEWASVPIEGFYGTQAFAILAEDAASLAQHLAATDDPVGQYDLSIAKWCHDCYPRVQYFVTSIPSFVQHIGEESSIRPGGPHFTFPSWPGEKWSYLQQDIDDKRKEAVEGIFAEVVKGGGRFAEIPGSDSDGNLRPQSALTSVKPCNLICTRCGKPIDEMDVSVGDRKAGNNSPGYKFAHYGCYFADEISHPLRDPAVRAAYKRGDILDGQRRMLSYLEQQEVCSPEKGCGVAADDHFKNPDRILVCDAPPKANFYSAGQVAKDAKKMAAIITDGYGPDIVLAPPSQIPSPEQSSEDTLTIKPGMLIQYNNATAVAMSSSTVRTCTNPICQDRTPSDAEDLPPEVAYDDNDGKGDLSAPILTTSRRVRAEDFRSDWLRQLAAEMNEPVRMHRKLWEYAAIAKVYLERVPRAGYRAFDATGYLRPHVLGFGVGRDPLAVWFASRGAVVVATDKPEETTSDDWKLTGQHASGKDQLRRLKSTTDGDWKRITYMPCDMNDIAVKWAGGVDMLYDLTWSCGSFEHIGGIQASIDFFVRQMACLKPGGVAVHTTEYSTLHTMLDSPDLCLLRSCDIAIIARRLAEQGDLLLPFDPTPGNEPADFYIDRPPYPGNLVTPVEGAIPASAKLGAIGPWHLSMEVGGHATTSIVLIAIRGNGAHDKLTDSEVLQTANANRELKSLFLAGKPDKTIKPSILFLGDAVVSSGFAKSTHSVCNYLFYHGWDVRVCGMNYYGQHMTAEDHARYPYPIHPAFDPVHGPSSPDGSTLLPRLIYDYRPDIVVIQQDPWNIPTYTRAIDQAFSAIDRATPPIVGFLAVDGANQAGMPLNRLAAVATWTQYGLSELRSGGYTGPGYVIPLGVDTEVFRPLDRQAVRRKFAESVRAMPGKLADDIDIETTFIVGFVGRNQPRKRIDLLLQSFSEWIRGIHGNEPVANAMLVLHVGPTGDTGFDIPSLVRYWKLDGRTIVYTPEIGQGETEEWLCELYNTFDLFATCTQGEGFWLPGFEAAACGVPIVAPRYSAISELFGRSAMMAECVSTIASAPINGAMSTLGGLVSIIHFVEILNKMYSARSLRDGIAENCLRLSSEYSWQSTGCHFEQMLRAILGFLETLDIDDDNDS